MGAGVGRKIKEMTVASKVKFLVVRALTDSFRRAGYEFNRVARKIAKSELSDEQIEQLNKEPLLAVIETEESAPDAEQDSSADGPADKKAAPKAPKAPAK